MSGLEGMLEIVGLEVMAEVSGPVRILRAGGREFQIVGAVTLKLLVPDKVQTATE